MTVNRALILKLILAEIVVTVAVLGGIFGLLFAVARVFDEAERRETGYSEVPPGDVEETNRVRAEKGIREIKPEWVFAYRQFNEEDWRDASGNQCKRVHRDEDEGPITWEQDYYYSGKSFYDPDNEYADRERLVITYDYSTGRFDLAYVGHDSRTEAILHQWEEGSLFGRSAETNEQTLEAADEILERWGINRL